MGLVILFVTDLEHYIIPNAVTYSLSALAIILSLLHIHPLLLNDLLSCLIGGIVPGLLLYLTSKIYLWIRKKEGMGMGDVKMIAMIGFWMGLPTTIMIIILSSILGSLVGISLILFKKMDRNKLIPFGSFLSLTTIILLIYMIFFNFYKIDINVFSF
jgi:leader peptidase (prepilin peptidase)/N-methyltransferase